MVWAALSEPKLAEDQLGNSTGMFFQRCMDYLKNSQKMALQPVIAGNVHRREKHKQHRTQSLQKKKSNKTPNKTPKCVNLIY